MSARKDDRSRFEKEYHRMTLIKHFTNRHHPNIYQGFNGKYNSPVGRWSKGHFIVTHF